MSSGTPQEGGETLLEVLISIAILGILSAAMFAGITSAAVAGDSHRRLSDVEVVARTYGEAVVNQAAHPTSTTLSVAAAVGDTIVTLVSNTGMAVGSSVSLDGEVGQVSARTGAMKITLASALTAGHAIGSRVTRYEPCPKAVDVAVSGFVTGSAKVSTPTVTSVEYFAPPIDAVTPPATMTLATCGTFWSTAGKPCSTYDAPPHYTACDPPVLRVTISVKSTDVADATRGASTTVQVLINRGNA